MNNQKTHNAGIYHCISCGRVEHAELEAEPPQCCGQSMARASTETIRDKDVTNDVTEEKTGGQSETAPPVTKGRKKPR